jgi:hypothetical protein
MIGSDLSRKEQNEISFTREFKAEFRFRRFRKKKQEQVYMAR